MGSGTRVAVRPTAHRAHSAAEAAPDETRRARIVLDYVSGMTDRYAISEAQRLLTG